jgi:hypothetical protein
MHDIHNVEDQRDQKPQKNSGCRVICWRPGTVIGGPVFYDIADTEAVFRWYRELLPALPEEPSGWIGIMVIEPDPALPEGLWGRTVCGRTEDERPVAVLAEHCESQAGRLDESHHAWARSAGSARLPPADAAPHLTGVHHEDVLESHGRGG